MGRWDHQHISGTFACFLQLLYLVGVFARGLENQANSWIGFRRQSFPFVCSKALPCAVKADSARHSLDNDPVPMHWCFPRISSLRSLRKASRTAFLGNNHEQSRASILTPFCISKHSSLLADKESNFKGFHTLFRHYQRVLSVHLEMAWSMGLFSAPYSALILLSLAHRKQDTWNDC